MLEIEKPKLECVELAENYGKFVVEPLERGFGTTLGNSMGYQSDTQQLKLEVEE